MHHCVSFPHAAPWTTCKRKVSKSWNFFQILWQKSFGLKFISIFPPDFFAMMNMNDRNENFGPSWKYFRA